MPSLSPDDILSPLNTQQRLAVQQIEGPLLILAGPGSGKTRVITHRIAHMINQGIPSQSIVALTFTNKAADEMRNRLQKLAPNNRTWTGTFHRFCSRLLRQHAELIGLQQNFTIYDSGDSKKVMKQAIENAKVDLKHYSADKLASQVSNVKNNGITAEHFQPRPGHALDSIVGKVYPEYQKLLKVANGVDFDDLLLHAVDLLKISPELRETLDRAFAYMMVDEYQDTNLTQYQLIRMLNHSLKNLAVTGDPDQSIYGWRGANINNILEFEKDYPGVNVVRLEQNYRSTPTILRVADQLIANNVRRKKKELHTENPEGEAVRLVTFPSPRDESLDIADTIQLGIESGKHRAKDYAVLYRANWLSRSVEHALRSAGLPYQIINGHEFYQRKEIKDVLGYLHLLNNPRDNVAFERVVNTPPRKIGKVTLGRLRRWAQDNNSSMLDAARNCDQIDTISKAPTSKLTQFVAMFDRLSFMSTDEIEPVIRAVLEETDYRNWLTLDGSEEGYERAGNVDELVVACEEFDRDRPTEGGLEAYLEQAALVSDTDIWESQSDRVTLMTLHAAKGLEFPNVYIVGLEDGILPHERSSTDDDQIEEERRLLFVGITRAEKYLQISRCVNRFRRGSFWPAIASRFLMELPREEMQIFEPAGTNYDEDSVADSISQIDPWMHDGLPSIDINDVSESAVAPEIDKIEAEVVLTDQPQQNSRPNPLSGISLKIQTAAQLAEKQAAMPAQIRLHPDRFETGMKVQHAEYGIGNIVQLTGQGQKRTATINFDTLGNKRFRLAFTNLSILD
ncbi:MAG: UvrD-helicase domain-containing protein [Planctomycetaceae bacterium]|nr:UvrD-helicase domain-containing protein [Planctomycetaceae bacterium]